MMDELIYESVGETDRRSAEAALASNDSEKIIASLLRSAYCIDDWRWVQDQCITFLKHSSTDVRRTAVICFGHLARIHEALDEQKVLEALDVAKYDPVLRADVEETLEEIKWFLHDCKKRA